jgi:hypothetical protein
VKATKTIVLGQQNPESVIRTQALLKNRSLEEFAEEFREGRHEAKKRVLQTHRGGIATAAGKVHVAG